MKKLLKYNLDGKEPKRIRTPYKTELDKALAEARASKKKHLITYLCDYLHCLNLDVDYNKSIGDLLRFDDVLSVEEENYIKETLLFYENVINKKEDKNPHFINEMDELQNVILSYPGVVISEHDGVFKITYPYMAGEIVPKRFLTFRTLIDDLFCVGTCFHQIGGWADCVFDEKELKTKYKDIVNKLVNKDVIEIIDCDNKIMEQIASFND